MKIAGSAINILFTIAFVAGYLGLAAMKEPPAPGATASFLNGSMKNALKGSMAFSGHMWKGLFPA
jgi:hypothetical protein